MPPSVNEIKTLLKLKPHPEGGFYAETYRAEGEIAAANLPGYGGARCYATGIYYLLTPDTFSQLHRVSSDEMFHFYLGDPVEMLELFPDGGAQHTVLGSDLMGGMTPQKLVRRGVWQGSRLVDGGRFALLGTTVAPGFEFADYQAGRRAELLALYPTVSDLIMELTR